MNPLRLFVFLTLFSSAISIHEQFSQCLSRKCRNDISTINVIFTPANAAYTPILQSRIQNLRFNTTHEPKPLAIVTPLRASQIQATITCARKYDIQIRIRSGGHDSEGLSYVSPVPFVMLDLVNFRNITVDAEKRVAWVGSGATLGELYYRIAEKSTTLAFPAGTAPTIGIGGHFSGGGYGYLLRKYGVAADHISDARLVDVNGRIVDRASMGEDLFWAIRGGGGNSFGVVIDWKVNLVPVPPTVTACGIMKTMEQNATRLLHRYQYVANKLPDDATMFAVLLNVNSTRSVAFSSIYLGRIDSFLQLMKARFPEIGLKTENCFETSWIKSLLITFTGFQSNNPSLNILLSRTNTQRGISKSKSDYIREPIPETALEGLVNRYSDKRIKNSLFFMVSYGGKMAEISESSIPSPHRAGILYMCAYEVNWKEQNEEAAQEHVNWIRKIYSYMEPYASKNPREAYANYRDLDIGKNNKFDYTSYKKASIWGRKYFRNNFERLVRVKTAVDPSNFFRNEQSIPPSTTW